MVSASELCIAGLKINPAKKVCAVSDRLDGVDGGAGGRGCCRTVAAEAGADAEEGNARDVIGVRGLSISLGVFQLGLDILGERGQLISQA